MNWQRRVDARILLYYMNRLVALPLRMKFRPCIDIHAGQVKQIVGGTLKDDSESLVTNFEATQPSSYFSELYRKDGLGGGHAIMLGANAENRATALEAVKAYPGGLQVGGGITTENALEFLEAGASHVIVTSFVFHDGKEHRVKFDTGNKRGLFCLCCLSWKWFLAFCLVLAAPRLLWQPGLGQPAEGAKYVYGLGLYWNLVMAVCFASPLLILCCCCYQPLVLPPFLGYFLWSRVISKAELKDGAAWPWFSIQEWGFHAPCQDEPFEAFRRYIRLRIHVHPSLQQYPPEHLACTETRETLCSAELIFLRWLSLASFCWDVHLPPCQGDIQYAYALVLIHNQQVN
eukprot:Skav225006  [mRNA]  locus=scaffold957:82844:94317:+ [translate_table: standard]